jgi:hypothetical protein
MAELEKGKPVSLEELMVSTLARTDGLAKLLIEKGVITDAEFKQKLLEERAVYQRVLNHKAIIISVKLWNYATNTSTLEYKKTCSDACMMFKEVLL